jgi:hypothetical protein
LIQGISRIFVCVFLATLVLSLPVNPLAITTQNGAYADPNTNMGKQLIKNERGDTYLTKEWSDGTGKSTFGLPEWIPDENGTYRPFIIMENPNTYVIENKYLPMSINKADCMTTLYLNNENILDGADTLMENQYWEVYHKENETDNYQLLDTSTWDCETTFSSGNNFSIFTTWEKLHGYETLQSSQYDTTSTNSTGTFYFRTLTETTTTPNVVTGQTTITNSTGTFTIDVIEDVTETTTTNIPVIPNEIKSEFQVEYRYMLDDGEVESFTRITNNDVNLENHYFQFVNKFDGVNFDAFNLGDDIEFTDDSYIGTYTALAENVPDKYIQIAQEGYPLYYSLEKGEEWWESASATIYMDGAEKKLNVQVDFGKDREPLALNTMQELDPTFVSSLSTDGRMITADQNHASCVDFTAIASSPTGTQPRIQTPTNSGNQACHSAYFSFDLSSLSNALVSGAEVGYTVDAVNGSPSSCEWVGLTTTPPDNFATYSQTMEGTVFATNDSSCSSTGSGKTVTLNSDGISSVSSSVGSAFNIGTTFVDAGQVRDGTEDDVRFNDGSATLTVTYSVLTVTGAPTSLSATGASTSQIDLSWTAPDTSSSTIPAVSGYRIQSSDFAFANSSLPTGRTADADVYGAITGAVDMDTANLYLSMNTTQNFGSVSTLGVNADGTNNGATTGATGKLSNGWDFDGSNDYVQMGGSVSEWKFLSDGSAWTISFWFNDDSSTQNSRFFNTMNDNSGSNRGISITHDSTNIGLGIYDGTASAGYPFSSQTSVFSDTGAWHLYTITYDGGNIASTSEAKVYKDASLVATITQGRQMSSSDPDHAPLMAKRTDNQRYVDGTLDDFAIWKKALTSDEITALYNSGNGAVATSIDQTNLTAYYNFEDSALTNKAESDIKMLDESYRGNHATQNGNPIKHSTASDGQFYDGTFTSGWTFDGASESSGELEISTSVQNKKSYKSLGEELDGNWVLRTKFDFDSGGDGGGIGLFDTGSSYWSGFPSSYTHFLGMYLANGGDVYGAGHSGSAWNTSSSELCNSDWGSGSTTDGDGTLQTGSTKYFEIIKESDQATFNIYDDSGYSDLECGVTRSFTDGGTSMVGFDSVVVFTKWTNQSHNYDFDDITIYTLDSNLTKDSSLNMEGTNSVELDGSSNYMTLPSDNTIIPTSSAFMMGANIKSDTPSFVTNTGTETNGATNANRVEVNQLSDTILEDSVITKLKVQYRGDESSTNTKLVLYQDNGSNTPSTLLAYTAPFQPNVSVMVGMKPILLTTVQDQVHHLTQLHLQQKVNYGLEFGQMQIHRFTNLVELKNQCL